MTKPDPKEPTRYPPATEARGATAEGIAKALLTPVKPPTKFKKWKRPKRRQPS